MHVNKPLVYVLLAIIALNIIAVLLLQEDASEPELAKAPLLQQPVVVSEAKPLVELRLLRADCDECFPVERYLDAWSDLLNISVTEGDAGLYGPTRLPAVAFNQTIEEYPKRLLENWETVGSIVDVDGKRWYVLPAVNPPYVESGEIKGLVKVTYLTMESCEECYDVMVHEVNLAEYSMGISSSRVVDVTSQEGCALIEKYNITSVPTLILSDDALLYPGFWQGWEIVGSREDDGTLVLRDLERLRFTHYDMDKETLMKAGGLPE